MTAYFSTDYLSARQAFLTAAEKAGAQVESFRNEAAELDATRLYTDLAALGDESAQNILVVMSGTHGVEGYAGSAIQTGVLHEGLAGKAAGGVRLLMIHALNPFGFACLRRANEDNIDLNRNFLDHDTAHPENREYVQLADLIAPAGLSPAKDLAASCQLMLYRLRYGQRALQNAITRGQYSHPTGLFYGGRSPSWSNRVLRQIARDYLGNAQRVVLVDIHTGLGPFGYGEVILYEPQGGPAYQRAVNCWGQERVKSTVNGKSVSSFLNGTVNRAFAEMLPHAEVTAAGLEFGTLPAMAVFRALRAENWAYHHGAVSVRGAHRYGQNLLRTFFPEDAAWRERVWEQGARAVERGLEWLSPT